MGATAEKDRLSQITPAAVPDWAAILREAPCDLNGLENRFGGTPSDEGSNPSHSASQAAVAPATRNGGRGNAHKLYAWDILVTSEGRRVTLASRKSIDESSVPYPERP